MMPDARDIRREWSEEHRSAERWPEDCPEYDPGYDYVPSACPQCGGSGTDRWGPDPEDVEECPSCDGHGVVVVPE